MSASEEPPIVVRQTILSPNGWSDDWRNTKRLAIVHEDGSMTGRVLLIVTDSRHREELICLHFLRQLAMTGDTERLGANLWKRDDPWDFRIGLSNGEWFNLEITSIADSAHSFVTHGREAELAATSKQKRITLRQLVKLEGNFPSAEIRTRIATLRADGAKAADLVENPFYEPGAILFTGRHEPPSQTLAQLIATALTSKSAKPHEGKDETIIIIDNRTVCYDLPDFEEAAGELAPVLRASPFPEIWVYTGYCSNDDGTNAEFTIFPLKTTNAKLQSIRRLARERGVDEYGRLVL